MAHIAPVAIGDLRDDLKPDVEIYSKYPGYVPNSFLTLANKPDIAKAFRNLQGAIADSLTFPAELRGMMWHVMSRNAGTEYCVVHSLHGLIYAGAVPKEKLDALLEFEDSPLFDEAERAALRFAASAGRDPKGVSEAEYNALREHFSEGQIVEMVAVMAIGGWMLRFNDIVGCDLEEMPTETARKFYGKDI